MHCARDYARMVRIMPSSLASCFAGLAFCAAAASSEAPRRVVSFNLCADQLVVALADPAQIAGLSPYATDPSLSVVAQAARPYRRLDWQAEATIMLQPDLVFVGPNDRSLTRRLLVAQGLRVEQTGFVTDLDSARKQIRDMAALLGHPERGERLVASLEQARARLHARKRLPFATALVVERGGYTQGPSSLAALLLSEAGLRPPADAPAGYGGFIALEKFLMLRPDLVFIKDPPATPEDQGSLFFMHPAMRALYPKQQRIALPTRYTMCGGPALIEALDYVAASLAALAPSR